MTAVWVLFLACAALSVFTMFTLALKRWPGIGALATAVTVLVAWEVPNPQALANVAGTNIFFQDILSLAFLAVSIMSRSQLQRNLGSVAWAWLALGLLLVVSLGRGTVEYSMGPTMNEFRGFLYPYAALTWAMSLTWTPDRARALLQKGTVVVGWGLVMVAAYHVTRYGIGSASGFVDAGTGLEQTTRPLVSGQALVLLMCTALSLWLWKLLSNNFYLFSATVFGVVVVLSQQRTVWGVTLAAAAAVLLFSSTRTKAIFLGLGVLGAIVSLFVTSSSMFDAVLAELNVAATDSGTYDARLTSWLNLVAESFDRGPETVIFGAPMGAGFGRLEGADRWVVFAPHNWYLTLYLRCGLIGLVLFLSFLALTFINAARHRINMAAFAVMVMMVVYGWSYSWLWYTGLIAGWAYAETNNRAAGQGRIGSGAVNESSKKSFKRQPKARIAMEPSA